MVLWFCHNCNGGPYNFAIQSSCRQCNHDKCSDCYTDNGKGYSRSSSGGQYRVGTIAKPTPKEKGHRSEVEISDSRDSSTDRTRSELGPKLISREGHHSEANLSDSEHGSDRSLVAEEIASLLLSRPYFRDLVNQAALIGTRSEVVNLLQPLLKRYGQDLDEMGRKEFHFATAREFERHARYIAEMILQKAPLQSSHVVGSSAPTSATRPEGDQDLSSPHWTLSKPALEEVKDFINSNVDAFNSFLTSVRRIAYSDPLEAVEHEVSRNIEGIPRTFSAMYHVYWELRSYIYNEFGVSTSARNSKAKLSSLLVLCGNLESGYAESCWAYMNWKWPNFTEPLLDAIQNGFSHSRSIFVQLL